jgi:acyl carrier protein
MANDPEMTRQVVRAAIAAVAKQPVRDDQCVVSTGMIDSLSVLKLIATLERDLQVHVPKDRVQPDDFDSVEIVLETLERVVE